MLPINAIGTNPANSQNATLSIVSLSEFSLRPKPLATNPLSAAPMANPVCCVMSSNDEARSRSCVEASLTIRLMIKPHIIPKPVLPMSAVATIAHNGPCGSAITMAIKPTATNALPVFTIVASLLGDAPENTTAPKVHANVFDITIKPATTWQVWRCGHGRGFPAS